MKGFTVFAPPPLPPGETEARERNSLLPFHLAREGTATIRLRTSHIGTFQDYLRYMLTKIETQVEGK